MWGVEPPPKMGGWGKAPSLGSVCVYILTLPTQSPWVPRGSPNKKGAVHMVVKIV